MRTLNILAAAVGLVVLTGTVQASAVFQGRDANGAVDNSCTGTGAGATAVCAMFYDSTLNITILNNWNIGNGRWDSGAGAGSAQAIAETAGFSVTGLTGWVLPTGDPNQAAGQLNQWLSIWDDVGASLGGLQAQFDGVQGNYYWSSQGTPFSQDAWSMFTDNGNQNPDAKSSADYAVAVRPGDVFAPVPEPQSLALVMLALGAGTVASRRRPR